MGYGTLRNSFYSLGTILALDPVLIQVIGDNHIACMFIMEGLDLLQDFRVLVGNIVLLARIVTEMEEQGRITDGSFLELSIGSLDYVMGFPWAHAYSVELISTIIEKGFPWGMLAVEQYWTQIQ